MVAATGSLGCVVRWGGGTEGKGGDGSGSHFRVRVVSSGGGPLARAVPEDVSMTEAESAARSGAVLLSLASRQAWPHILAAAHVKPWKLVLLHSADENESRRPAERLKAFFDETRNLVGDGRTELQEIPDDDFQAVESRLDELSSGAAPGARRRVLNFTGGNKLMATAAFRWAERNEVASFYLERRNRLTWFEPSGSGFATSASELKDGIANDLDLLALLRCQLSASQVERPGQRLTLSEQGKGLRDKEFREQVMQGAVDALLRVEGTADRIAREGDALELQTAAVVLKHGAAEVRRSLRLKVDAPSSSLPHAEIDLLFNWDGRLWLVDCKDRVSGSRLVHRLRNELRSIPPPAEQLLRRLGDEMKIGPIKALKEDLVANVEVGGLRGKVVCVRKVPLPEEVHPYAQRNDIDVVQKQDLFQSFRRLMYPRGRASREDFDALARRFAR